MIKNITLCNFYSYQGTTTIKLDPELQLSSVLGRNGSGKTTFMKALAYAVGAKDIADLSQSSHVEIVLSDGSSFLRRGQNECFVNGTLCNLSQLQFAAREIFQVHNLDLSEDWRHIFSDPQRLMEYIELIPTGPGFDSGNFSTSPDALKAYKNLVNEEAKLALQAAQSKTTLTKLRRRLSSLSSAQAVQERIEISREASRKLQAAREIYKASLCALRVEILDIKRATLMDDLNMVQSVEAKDLDVLRRTSEELESMIAEQKSLSLDMIKARERFSLLIEELSRAEVESNRKIPTSELYKAENHSRQLLQKWLHDKHECLEAQVEYLSCSLSFQDLLKCEYDGLKLQLALLQRCRLDFKGLRHGLDQVILKTLDELELSQTQLVNMKEKTDENHGKLYRLERSLTETMTSIRVMKAETFLEDQSKSRNFDYCNFVESLKLMNPQILGDILSFVKPAEQSKLSPEITRRVLRSISEQKESLCFIVESDEMAMSFAKKLPCYESRELTFLARSSVEVLHELDPSIPEQIVQKYPSVCWLRSLVKTEKKSDSHLVNYVAGKVMVVPDCTVAQDVFRLWDEGIQAIDHSGTIYTRNCGIRTCESIKMADGSFVKESCVVALEGLSRSAQDMESQIANLKVECFESELNLALEEGRLSRSQMELKQLETMSSSISLLQYNLIQESKQLESSLRVALLSLEELRESKFERSSGISQTNMLLRTEELAKQVQSKLDSLHSRNSNCASVDLKVRNLFSEKSQLKEFLIAQHERIMTLKQDIRGHGSFLLENSVRPKDHAVRLELMQKGLGDISIAMARYETEAEEAFSAWQLLTGQNNKRRFEMLTGRAIQLSRKPNGRIVLSEIHNSLRRLDKEINDCGQIYSARTDTTELDAHSDKLLAEIVGVEQESVALTARHATTLKALSRLRSYRHSSIRTRLMNLAPNLESIYKNLYSQVGSASAQTYLKFVDEKNLDRGVSFFAIPAGKPFRPISQLSGGELSLAIIAFCLASAKTFGARALLIDEMDAHLDNAGIRALAYCLVRLSRGPGFPCSIFVATHQRKIYNCADQFIGLFKDNDKTDLIVAK